MKKKILNAVIIYAILVVLFTINTPPIVYFAFGYYVHDFFNKQKAKTAFVVDEQRIGLQ